MMCSNVCGWCKGGRQIDQMREDVDIRAKVIDFYRPGMVTLVETLLKGDEEVLWRDISSLGTTESTCIGKQ